MSFIDFQELLLYFVAYAFLGRIIETIFVALAGIVNGQRTDIVHESFLHLPITPIYGFGAIIIITIYSFLPPETNVGIVFLIFALATGLLEFLTGELLKQIYGKNIWWDYSHKKFQIRGQVCLQNIILFGLGGLILVYLIQPFFAQLLAELSAQIINVSFWFFTIIILLDFLYSARQYWQSSRGKKELRRLGFKDFKL